MEKKKYSNYMFHIKMIIIMIVGFVITELLQGITINIPELKIIDLRLVYIFIISAYMGVKYGVISAILVSIAYIQKKYGVQNLFILFYNTNNWTNIVIYILFSIVIGIKTDMDFLKIKKCKSDIEKLNKEISVKDDKLIHYEDEIKNINYSLITHNKSYTRISKFISDVQNNKNDVSIIEQSLKEIFENENVEVKNHTALNKYNKDIQNLILDGKVYINKELRDDIPSYIIPIYIYNQLKYIIDIRNCSFDQMDIDYKNTVISIRQILENIL